MFLCPICGKEYAQKYNLLRHQKTDKLCGELKNLRSELKNLRGEVKELRVESCDLRKEAEKYKTKYIKTKEALKLIVDERKELKQTINQLQHEKDNMQLKDERNNLYHQLEVAKGRLEEREYVTGQFVEIAKQNKTVINNTVIINDFRIKSADEFDDANKDQLIDFIRNKEISFVYQWLLELLYWTKPPNISIRDQSRKKVMILRENKWIQENVDVLVHRMFYRTIKPIVMNCIDEQLIKNNHNNEEMLVWEEIKELWSGYDHKKLSQPFLQTVSNLQNHHKLLNIN